MMLKLFKKSGLVKIAVFLILFAVLAVSFLFGAKEIIAGGSTFPPGHGWEMSHHGQCRWVQNRHVSLSVWVPWLTSAEWNNFILHHPAGHITVAHCCVPEGCPTGACDWQSDGCGGSIWCGTCPTPTPTPPPPGCFLSGTRVLMADGSYKEIQEIKPGDIVLSYDFKNRSVKPEKVAKLLINRNNPGGHLIWNDTLKVTRNHRIWSVTHGAWQTAETFKIGDQVLGPDSEPITITSIKQVQGYFTVYNLTLVGPNKTFFAEGVLVHNVTLAGEVIIK